MNFENIIIHCSPFFYNLLRCLINWCRLASVSSFFLFRSHQLIILHNVKLVAFIFISIRVFFVLLFHVIVPNRMVACKTYTFHIVIQQFLSFKLHWRLRDPQYLFFLSPHISVFSSKTAVITCLLFCIVFFAFVCSSFPYHLKFCCVNILVNNVLFLLWTTLA